MAPDLQDIEIGLFGSMGALRGLSLIITHGARAPNIHFCASDRNKRR